VNIVHGQYSLVRYHFGISFWIAGFQARTKREQCHHPKVQENEENRGAEAAAVIRPSVKV